MRVLLDTSIFIWYISANERLETKYLNIIKDLDNDIYLSIISIWEITIKQQLGKINFAPGVPEYFINQ